MKKLLLLTAITLFGMTACQKAESPEITSDEVQITVETSLPGQLDQTRAVGDGTTVDRCIMQIYLDGELYGERQVATVSNLKATFSARMIAGKTYELVFWADKHGTDKNADLHYNTTDLSQVTFAEGDAYKGNDETRDAFFGKVEVTADQNKSVPVDLKRPFGQLNVRTLDLEEVKAAAPALEPKKVKVSFVSLPTGINLRTGALLDDSKAAVAYTDAAAVVDAAGNLSFDYIFAPAGTEQYLTDFTMSFLDDAGTAVASDYEFASIPVQRNYRTMVSGNLLTKKADITVNVVPGFDGTIDKKIVEVATLKDLNTIIMNGGNAKMVDDITISGLPTYMFNDAEIDLNGNTLTVNTLSTASKSTKFDVHGASLTFKNGTIEANTMKNDLDVLIIGEAGSSVVLDDVIINTNGVAVGPNAQSTITIKDSELNCGPYAVATNASGATNQDYGVKIEIENTTMKGATPMCINIPCTLIMDGCTVIGNTQGMMLRGGRAMVSNSTIVLDTNDFTSAEDAEFYANYFEGNNWETGNKVNVAALTVGNKVADTSTSYQYPTELDLRSTTVWVRGTYASYFPAMYVWANQGEGLGVSIVYDPGCSFMQEGGSPNAIVYGSKNITVNGEPQNE